MGAEWAQMTVCALRALRVLWQWGGCKDFNAGTEQLRLDWGSGEPMGAEVLVGICKSL